MFLKHSLTTYFRKKIYKKLKKFVKKICQLYSNEHNYLKILIIQI